MNLGCHFKLKATKVKEVGAKGGHIEDGCVKRREIPIMLMSEWEGDIQHLSMFFNKLPLKSMSSHSLLFSVRRILSLSLIHI